MTTPACAPDMTAPFLITRIQKCGKGKKFTNKQMRRTKNSSRAVGGNEHRKPKHEQGIKQQSPNNKKIGRTKAPTRMPKKKKVKEESEGGTQNKEDGNKSWRQATIDRRGGGKRIDSIIRGHGQKR